MPTMATRWRSVYFFHLSLCSTTCVVTATLYQKDKEIFLVGLKAEPEQHMGKIKQDFL